MALDRPLEIKVLRTIAQLNQTELAIKCGVTRETISNWERYETFPDAIQLYKLAKALNCNIDDIFFPVTVRKKRTEVC